MKRLIKRYAAFIAVALCFGAFILALPAYRGKAADSLLFQIRSMLLVIPPVFLLLGLLDSWVPRETMMKYMGPGSGPRGGLLAFLLGSFAAGPLYGAFPVAAVLMKKGASFTNVLVFLGAWATTKVPMLLFEARALGIRFTLSMLAADIVGMLIIAFFLGAMVPEAEREKIYEGAQQNG